MSKSGSLEVAKAVVSILNIALSPFGIKLEWTIMENDKTTATIVLAYHGKIIGKLLVDIKNNFKLLFSNTFEILKIHNLFNFIVGILKFNNFNDLGSKKVDDKELE